jgi:outer membrane protein OmpA-like peptidoglycan-associated protein
MNRPYVSIGVRAGVMALLLAVCATSPSVAGDSVVAGASALSGGSAGAGDSALAYDTADKVGAVTLPGRAGDSRVRLPAALIALQTRLDALTTATVVDTVSGTAVATGVNTAIATVGTGRADCESEYRGQKAQAWLNFAEYGALNDAPRSVTGAAVDNVRALVSGLETHAAAVTERAELPGAHHVRADLWRMVAAVRADGGRCAAPKMTAYCEVQLAWVGYEASVGGWRHVDPYLRIAEDYCGAAAQAAAVAQAAPEIAATLTPEPVHAEPVHDDVASAIPDDVELSVDVLFPHDRWRPSEMLEPGDAMIAKLAKQVNALPRNTLIMVVGHADVTGGLRHNKTLSARRANSVAQELTLHGIDAARIKVSAVGSADPLVSCSQVRPRMAARATGGAPAASGRAHYWACLEPNRRVVIRLWQRGGVLRLRRDE